jgi:hypothetical protein
MRRGYGLMRERVAAPLSRKLMPTLTVMNAEGFAIHVPARASAPGQSGGEFMKRTKQERMEQLKVSVPPEVLAALDDFARAQGLSRADAVRAALLYSPPVARFLTHGPVASRDVLGP